MITIGVVGASGFVGRHLAQELLDRGYAVRAIVRSAGCVSAGAEEVVLGDFTAVSDWKTALEGLDALICLVARAHVISESTEDPLAEFRRVNVETTMRIAQAAADVGVRRFVYMSSIGVNGESTVAGSPFKVTDAPRPVVPYAISKLESEIALQRLHDSGALDVVFLRCPIVYGTNAKGNFQRIARLVRKGLPLPLGRATEPRAMISIHNLNDALIAMIDSPRADRMLALVNDRTSLSTASLIRCLASGMGKKTHLVPVPIRLLRGLMSIIGMGSEADKLTTRLEIEISATWPEFNWTPPFESESEVYAVGQALKNSK